MIGFHFIFAAYALTEDSQHREIDGPSNNIALSDIISNVLPSDGKKDKLDLNNVIDIINFLFETSIYTHLHSMNGFI